MINLRPKVIASTDGSLVHMHPLNEGSAPASRLRIVVTRVVIGVEQHQVSGDDLAVDIEACGQSPRGLEFRGDGLAFTAEQIQDLPGRSAAVEASISRDGWEPTVVVYRGVFEDYCKPASDRDEIFCSAILTPA